MRIDISGYMITGSTMGWYGGNATGSSDVVQKIKATPTNEAIDVYINSSGGSVFAGVEIYSELRQRANVNIFVTGLAASAASIVCQAGTCKMSPAATMMIHCVSTYAAGNAQDMRKAADTLETLDNSIVQAYIEKTGKTKEELLALMQEETWLNVDQAINLGLCEGVWQAAAKPNTPAPAPTQAPAAVVPAVNAYKNKSRDLELLRLKYSL